MTVSVDALATEVGALDACATVEQFAEATLDLLWGLIPCEGVGFNEIDDARRRIELFRSRSFVAIDESDEAFWSYADELPICHGLPPGAPGVVRTEDILSQRELRKTRIFAEVLRPSGSTHEMKLAFASPPWMSRAIIFGRSDRAFSDRERNILLLIAPHLSRTYRHLRVVKRLTEREREVLELVARGLTNREVAVRLDVTPGTVRAHLEHTFAKLNVGTRTAAVAATR